MKRIPLTTRWGEVWGHTVVDDRDYDFLMQWKWHPRVYRKTVYAGRSIWNGGDQKKFFVHREIILPASDMVVDHIDGDGLNNQRANLRVCTHSQNRLNTGKRANNTSGLKGAYWSKAKRKWESYSNLNGVRRFLGRFDTAQEAHDAYVRASSVLHGEFFHA
jgi:hypothetical protein